MSADDGDSALGCELLSDSHRNFGPPGQRGMFTAPEMAQRRRIDHLTHFDN